MDREIKEELEKHKQDKINLVRKELAWESDKQRIALEKLRKRYTVFADNFSGTLYVVQSCIILKFTLDIVLKGNFLAFVWTSKKKLQN